MTAPPPPHRDPRVVDAAATALDVFTADRPGVVTAAVLTDDGFEVARAPRPVDADGRLASMASSLQALGEAIARALALGATAQLALIGDEGSFIVRRIAELPLALVVVLRDTGSGVLDPADAARLTSELASGLAEALAPARA